MTAHYCPDCGLFEVSIRKPGKDGRCDWCRAQIGRRRQPRTHWRDQADEQFRHLVADHNPH
ncbi:hypothetical protein [Blastococcus saxobsidens]|uniref:Uncharacterized protein n=1 Tax=Blastococcus saxobsidens TaxID=138336 RepID=A0A4Q7Y9G1_9ACTN|nr:hypothetical protein [Blastococcus saxobsidens]RZU32709.1 hypothetical protein BKA19_2411 [Blastococcus saxobsidens]